MPQLPIKLFKVLFPPAEPAVPNAIYFVQPTADDRLDAFLTDSDGYLIPIGNADYILGVMAAAMALKANLASPHFTGIPTGPTAVLGTDTTQLATTAFVIATRDAILNAAPGVLDTLQELAAALGNDPSFAATTAALIATKAAKSDIITAEFLFSSTGVNLNEGTAAKQALYTVPASRRGRSSRIDIDLLSGVPTNAEFTIGWNAGADDVIADPIHVADLITDTADYAPLLAHGRSVRVGTTGQVLGLKVTTPEGSALTARVNSWGSLTNTLGVAISSL